MSNITPEYYSPKDIAIKLGVHVNSIHNWTAKGMPFLPIGKRGKRYNFTDCKNWLESRFNADSKEVVEPAR
jgi:hypothetical protein